MKSRWLAAGFAIALGIAGVGTIGVADVAIAQAPVDAQKVDVRKVEADRLLQQGIQQHKISQFEAAMKSWQQSLNLYREIEHRKGEVTALGNLGNAYYSLGNYPKAIEFQEQSLAIAREIEHRKGEGIALGSLGIIYYSLGNYPKAIEFQEQSLAIAREIKDRRGEGGSLGNLGLTHYSLGNYPKAIEFLEQSLAIARETKYRKGEGTTLSNLGISYYSLGNYSKAIEFLEQRLVIAREIKDRGGEGAALGNMGNVYYSLGNYSKAIESHERSLMIAREIKDRQGEGTAIGGLGLAYYPLGNYPKAIEFQEQSLAIAREIKDRQGEGTAIGNLGISYYSLGNYPKAIKSYEQYLAITREVKDRDGEFRALNNLGGALKEQEPELAIVFYKQSVNVAESIRKENRKLDRTLQESYTKTVADTYRRLADLLLAQGRVLEAQQVLELLKDEELRTYTRTSPTQKNNASFIRPEQPIPAAYNDKITLGNDLTECEKIKCARRSQLIAQVTRANENYDQLVKRLKAALKSQEQKDPAQLQTEEFTRNAQNIILANPKIKTLLLYPLVLDDKLWLVWGTQAGKTGVVFDSKAIPVTRKELSTKVLELQNLLSNPNSNPKELQRVSQQLYQWIIQPIRKQLDDNEIKNIVFSLDRATRYIPMNALYDGKQYLVENFATSTILTAQTDTTDRLSLNPTETPVLGFGLTQAINPFSALPAVRTELDSIIRTSDQSTAGLFPGLKFFDRDFTETALRENITDHRILHIATHGSFLTSNPDESFLLLGNGKKLSIPTIESMKNLAGTHLVVLSACETGKGGMNSEGLEVAGMGHYFLKGGAKSVMASLWLVNDPATALLMREFYNQLKGNTVKPGITKPEALQQVQIAFIKGNLTHKEAEALDRAGGRRYVEGQLPANSFAHPYYWAPFILMGNNQ